MSDSITSQLLLAVRAREAFRTETDSVVGSRVAGIFPGSTHQTLKLRRAAYVTQKKKEENKVEEEKVSRSEVQSTSLQGVLSSSMEDTAEPESADHTTLPESNGISFGGKQSSIQEEYNLLLVSIKNIKERVQHLKGLLVRAKLLTMDSSASCIEAVRLEYLTSRLIRLRQLNVIPSNSDRKAEASESYFLWCTNQRNLAIRKAKLDTEEMRKRRQQSSVQQPMQSAMASPEPKKLKGIGNIFGAEDGGRHVKFNSIDTDSGDRRISVFGVPEGPVLADPLTTGDVPMSEVMTRAGQAVLRRHRMFLDELRKLDAIYVEVPTAPVPALVNSDIGRMDNEGSEPITKASRTVSFCENTTKTQDGANRAPALSNDFISFNFDDEGDIMPLANTPATDIHDSTNTFEPEQPAVVGGENNAKQAPIATTPSAKLQRRFSMSSTRDNFTSFVETKNHSNTPEQLVPMAYREVNDDGNPIHNPKHLKMAAILKSLSTSSSAGLSLFEKEVESRMRRCLDFAADAVNGKFVMEGDVSKVSAGNDEFAQRVREKELIIASTAEYMKNIGTGIAEGYFTEIKEAHQLVLQAQLTRLERLQRRFPAAPSDRKAKENDNNSSLSDDDAQGHDSVA